MTLETELLLMVKILFCALVKKEAKRDLGSVIVGASLMYVN